MQITDRRRVLRLREDNGIGARSRVTRSNTGADVPRLAMARHARLRTAAWLLPCHLLLRTRADEKEKCFLFICHLLVSLESVLTSQTCFPIDTPPETEQGVTTLFPSSHGVVGSNKPSSRQNHARIYVLWFFYVTVRNAIYANYSRDEY
jgi:hypothetical protein